MHGDSPLDPITRAGPDRRDRWCQCAGCGCIARCTPHFDFYVRSRSTDTSLYCQRCLLVPRKKGRRHEK